MILIRTPYDKNALKPIGEDGAQRGYAVVVQDTRGRFASEGANLPFEGDGWWENRADGVDTVQWIARQAWCNGKIGTWGGSALGINQLMLAGAGAPADLPTHHRRRAEPASGVVPRAACSKSRWWRTGCASPARARRARALDAPPRLRRFLAGARCEPPLSVRGRARGAYRRLLRHLRARHDRRFVGYQTRGGQNARGTQKLLMGPWAHGVLQKRIGELEFPNADQPPCTFHDP